MSIIIDLKMTSKKCSKCDIVKDFREFYKDKSRKDGYRNRCKICHSESKKLKDSKVEYKPKPKVQEKVVVVECNECYKCHLFVFLPLFCHYHPHCYHHQFQFRFQFHINPHANSSNSSCVSSLTSTPGAASSRSTTL